jgi:hypothetical protein
MRDPVTCPKCGQSGAEPPGFRRAPFPEAIDFNGELFMVEAFACCNCDLLMVFRYGTIEVRSSYAGSNGHAPAY